MYMYAEWCEDDSSAGTTARLCSTSHMYHNDSVHVEIVLKRLNVEALPFGSTPPPEESVRLPNFLSSLGLVLRVSKLMQTI